MNIQELKHRTVEVLRPYDSTRRNRIASSSNFLLSVSSVMEDMRAIITFQNKNLANLEDRVKVLEDERRT